MISLFLKYLFQKMEWKGYVQWKRHRMDAMPPGLREEDSKKFADLHLSLIRNVGERHGIERQAVSKDNMSTVMENIPDGATLNIREKWIAAKIVYRFTEKWFPRSDAAQSWMREKIKGF